MKKTGGAPGLEVQAVRVIPIFDRRSRTEAAGGSDRLDGGGASGHRSAHTGGGSDGPEQFRSDASHSSSSFLQQRRKFDIANRTSDLAASKGKAMVLVFSMPILLDGAGPHR